MLLSCVDSSSYHGSTHDGETDRERGRRDNGGGKKKEGREEMENSV